MLVRGSLVQHRRGPGLGRGAGDGGDVPPALGELTDRLEEMK